MTGTASISRVEDEEEDEDEKDEEEKEDDDDDDEQHEREEACTRGGRRPGRGYTATKSVLNFCNNDARSPRRCKYATYRLR